MQLRELETWELDDVIELHIQGLTHELKLLDQIITFKSTNTKGKPELKKVLIHILDQDEGQIFIAKEGKEIIGYILVTKKFYPVESPNLCGCINGIYIKESSRKQGIGKKLFQLAEGWLKNRHITNLELYHMINDETATAFWKNMGFVNVQYNCAKKINQ